MKLKDLTGQRFGMLTVKSYVGGSKWLCVCDCGNAKAVNGYKLKSGNTVSCGCKKAQNILFHTDETRRKMSESAKKRGIPESVRLKGVRNKANSEKGGRTEKNRNAKEWYLISPNGERYHVSNLLDFIRKHAEMFGVDENDDMQVTNVRNRFSALKFHMNKNDGLQTTCCGGWSIEIPEDDRINKYKTE